MFHRTCDAGLKMATSHCGLFYLWLVSCSVNIVSNQKTPLHIGGMSVISNHWWIHARAFPYVIESAFEDVNNSPEILADYELLLDMEDDQASLYFSISCTTK